MEMVASSVSTLAVATARTVGEFEAIDGALSGWGAGLMSVLTQLGSFWFLSVLLGLCFWRLPEKRAELLALFATALGGVGLYQTLKYSFEIPRPGVVLIDPTAVPGLLRPLYEYTITISGYGFPSGHATTATILYGGLVLVLTVGPRRQRIATAAALITVVCVSRVALGVHALIDVIGGVATGLAALGLLFVLPKQFLPERRVYATLAAAMLLAVLYFLASGGDPFAIGVAALTLAAMGGWWLLDSRKTAR